MIDSVGNNKNCTVTHRLVLDIRVLLCQGELNVAWAGHVSCIAHNAREHRQYTKGILTFPHIELLCHAFQHEVTSSAMQGLRLILP